ncbi:MAG: hypothetical protein K8S55_04710 [Phycisphaerae bacterium]|nr:hypothetical protein [Phycisphaerae bacterium]
MTMTRSLGMLVLGILALSAVGCKSVQTTFVNTTSESLELQVNGPGFGTGYLGTLPPNGQIRTLIQVSPIWLPTTYTYTAGKHKGAFSIASDSKSDIQEVIPEGAKAALPPWRHADGKTQTGGLTPVTYEP